MHLFWVHKDLDIKLHARNLMQIGGMSLEAAISLIAAANVLLPATSDYSHFFPLSSNELQTKQSHSAAATASTSEQWAFTISPAFTADSLLDTHPMEKSLSWATARIESIMFGIPLEEYKKHKSAMIDMWTDHDSVRERIDKFGMHENRRYSVEEYLASKRGVMTLAKKLKMEAADWDL